MARPGKNNPNGEQISPKFTEESITKLRHAFSIDATVEEAAFYANISVPTIYRWFEQNVELKEELNRLRETPVFKARNTVVDSLGDPDMAFKYLERKKKKEFSLRQELTGADGEKLPTPILQVHVSSDDGNEEDTGIEE